MQNTFKFEVGSMYENMKGIYEVVSIQRGTMVIRWQNGSVLSTTVDLQKRIIERMALDKDLQQQEDLKQQEKPKKRKTKASSVVD